MTKGFALSVSLFVSAIGFSQTASNYFNDNNLGSLSNDGSTLNKAKTTRLPIHFGVQVNTILPTKFIQSNAATLNGGSFETSIKQTSGFGFGGSVRVGLTNFIALETGMNFTQRRYDLTVAVPSSNIEGSKDMTFVDFDVPINAVIYIPLSEKFFMNTSFGVAMSYKPSDTRVSLRHGVNHFFSLHGVRDKRVGFDLNASIGGEYRTDNFGFFFLGVSARVPFSPLFQYAAIHQHNTNATVLLGDVSGSFLTLDLKYYFPIRKK